MSVRRALLTAALLTATGCGTVSTGSGAATGTVAGQVQSSPSCPVERVGSPCPPRPVAGALVEASVTGHRVGSTRTGPDGRFALSVPAGRVTLTATNAGGYRSQATKTVTVRAAATVHVVLVVDSGIR